jgi:hypothetical protein
MASYIKEALSKRNTSQILRERDRLKYQAFISITQSKVNYNTLNNEFSWNCKSWQRDDKRKR